MPWAGDPYFTKEEMRCKGFEKQMCSCGGILPLDDFMYDLVEIRREYGVPMIVSSGARCAEYNAKVTGSSSEGAHVRGVAADIKVHGANSFRLLGIALRHGMTGIGVAQKGSVDSRFIHLDTIQPNDPVIFRPVIWSY